MLIGLNPILSPDLLHVLASMGHGDEIVIVDSNYPAHSCGKRVVRLDGVSGPEVVEAVLSVMPLDSFVDDPALSMEYADDPEFIPEVLHDYQKVINDTADAAARIARIDRFAFYDRSRLASAVIQTGERRIYGNLILKKGVVLARSS
ncbi:L-fucose mutarotase [Aliiruegeria haliotis]|uniref:L-fucose mutarotase n=1 Tax=Aliiruegeria haliotis TaxID=1280846 RepID=A0A2T0REU6_9RHOB|nr:RbsD/FucU domain-containing protein [Aliiruegeria haliotis]PRY19677.1 L-fucose mutarotase [Aliiruegeria haliotis]